MRTIAILLFLFSILLVTISSLLMVQYQNNDIASTSLTCTNGYCTNISIEEIPYGCNYWLPSHDTDNLFCRYTTEGLDSIDFIADEANFVRSPISKYDFSVNHLHIPFVSNTTFRKYGENNLLIFYDKLPQYNLLYDYFNETVNLDILLELSGENLTSIDLLKNFLYNSEILRDSNIEFVKRRDNSTLDLVSDPNFLKNREVYVYYTFSNYSDLNYRNRTGNMSLFSRYGSYEMVLNRVSKFTLKDGSFQDEKILIDNITAPNTSHQHDEYPDNDRFLEIGPDDRLYISTQDIPERLSSQNLSLLSGKILRINLNGSIPYDNPFNGSPVFSYGHRNPQDMAWDSSGNMFLAEQGPWMKDEINQIKPGKNYGWDVFSCDERIKGFLDSPIIPDENHISPIFCTDDWILEPRGIEYLDDPSHPWHDSLFVAGRRGGHLHRFIFDDGNLVDDEIFYIPNHNGDFIMDPELSDVYYINGSLFVVGMNQRVAEIRPESAQDS